MWWSFWSRRRDSDLDDEIAHDLALDAEERIQSGMSRQQAEQSTRRDFGNVALVKEDTREAWAHLAGGSAIYGDGRAVNCSQHWGKYSHLQLHGRHFNAGPPASASGGTGHPELVH